ncbi:hypothetical protein JCGZ_24311 [Jatropha curcas]|uniref:Ubiquitin-like domain-containing protein n=1 Tax=Jatropha curcas TaxID=180498 RepID=A0A067JY69_JATCU|nr:ubiquitin-40S ribosomal protein S27a-like [Jatropha curcas]KDP24960.1 hypothetical protein JCGZ_24311 [Jatropha curcas]
MQVFVKIPAEKTLVLDVSPANTVTDMKINIQNKAKIPKDQQRLIFTVNQLEDDQTLAFYNIRHESTLYLLLRLPGGGGNKKKKRKVFTTPKKEKHEKEKEKLAVLKYYKVDDEDGKVERLRKECSECGPGIFMANHSDRYCCGKCGLTILFNQTVDSSSDNDV